MSGGPGFRRKVFVGLVSLVVAVLITMQLSWFKFEYITDTIVYFATGTLWPLFWGFILVIIVGLVLD